MDVILGGEGLTVSFSSSFFYEGAYGDGCRLPFTLSRPNPLKFSIRDSKHDFMHKTFSTGMDPYNIPSRRSVGTGLTSVEINGTKSESDCWYGANV